MFQAATAPANGLTVIPPTHILYGVWNYALNLCFDELGQHHLGMVLLVIGTPMTTSGDARFAAELYHYSSTLELVILSALVLTGLGFRGGHASISHSLAWRCFGSGPGHII